MRPHSAEAAKILTGGSFGLEVTADVMYGSTRLLQNVPLTDWSFTGDYDAKIKGGGSATVVYQDDFARSYTPRQVTDALAPFGQELRVYAHIADGAFAEPIMLGVYRIVEDPRAKDEQIVHEGRTLTVGSEVELSLLDRFYAVDVPFMALEQPQSLVSAWGELIRVGRLVGTRTVSDAAIPVAVTYPRNRLEAVQQLAGRLAGRAYMRSDGTVGIIPDAIGAPVLDLHIGEDVGTILDVGQSLTSDGVHNAVFCNEFEDADGAPIVVAPARITDGPLSVAGPFGERPVEYPSDQREFIRTPEAARQALDAHLALVSRRGPIEVPVEITPDPRIEIGDVVRVHRPDASQTFVGRVIKAQLSKESSMKLTVRVPSA